MIRAVFPYLFLLRHMNAFVDNSLNSHTDKGKLVKVKLMAPRIRVHKQVAAGLEAREYLRHK